MKTDVVMPEMGESVTEGTVSQWLKQTGDPVKRDENLLEITTDKVDTVIPCPQSGVLAEIVVSEGDTVEVGAVLARIETDKSEDAAPEEDEKPKAEPREAADREMAAEKKDEESRIRLTGVARRIVEEEDLEPEDVESIPGSGSGGRVTKQDVLDYLAKRREKTSAQPEEPGTPPPAAPAGQLSHDRERSEVIPMSPMRKRISEHMVLSKHTSAHTYTVAEVDMSRIVEFREGIKREFEEEEGFKLTYTPFILYAVVQTLKEWPDLNSSVEEDTVIRKHYINLGVAVALEEGLIVPVIRDADEKNLLGLARAAHDLARRARRKQLKPEEVQGGTFTVTNPGAFGNVFGLAIINQPQVGILDVGAIRKRPVAIDDAIAIRSMMYLSLSYDHRVVDGAVAARFLQDAVHGLENYDLEQAL